MHLFYVSSQNSSGVEQLTRNEQVKGSIPFFGSDGSFGNRFFFFLYPKTENPGRSPGTNTREIRLLRLLYGNGCLGGSETGDGNTERRAGNIIKTDLVAECDGLGITSMLTTDAQLDVRIG